MKKLLLAVLGVLALSVPSFASGLVGATLVRSSFTSTNDNLVYISSSGYLEGVIVGVASAGGVLTIYSSTWTATNSVVVSSISLATVQNYTFGGVPVKGIFYRTVGNANGVHILYRNK